MTAVFLLILILPVMFGIALLGLAAAVICRCSLAVGLLSKPWQLIVLVPLLMTIYPLWLIHQDQIATAACVAASGPEELSCTGELGGALFDLLRWGLLFGSLIGGPLLGRALAKRWLKLQGNVAE